MNQSVEFITFYLGELFFGIVATDVLELNRDLKVTPVPKSNKTVRGIVNLRGEIVPAFDMHERFGLDSVCMDDQSISIILASNGLVVAALVDDVGEIIELRADTFEPPPNNFPAISRELILGVHKLPDKLLLIVDSKKLTAILKVPDNKPRLAE